MSENPGVYIAMKSAVTLCEKLNIVPRATGGTLAAINVPLGTGARGDVFSVRTSKVVENL